jgi:probable phosphoglycerate mutase
MNNSYYVFRHGESRANVEGIIVSDPVVGTVDYGLTDEGRRQVRAGISGAEIFDADTLIVSSDFLRAVQTAEIIREALGAAPVVFDERLRERFFGEREGLSHENYAATWKNDASDPNQAHNGAETVGEVLERMQAVISSLEEAYSGRKIILVSHGDPLMILLSSFAGVGPGQHRSLPYIGTAEIRPLN